MSRPNYSPEANQRALEYINQYTKENYDRITILRTKGDKDKLDVIAKERGMSRNELINWCIDQQLKEVGAKL